MSDNVFNYEIKRGESLVLNLKDIVDDGIPIDLTVGYEFQLMVRKKISDAAVVADRSIIGNGRFAITGANNNGISGAIFTAAESGALELCSYVYDGFLTSPTGIATPFIEGQIVVENAVTR